MCEHQPACLRCRHCCTAECRASRSPIDRSGFASDLAKERLRVQEDLGVQFKTTSKVNWVPGQVLICPVESHPAIHLGRSLVCKLRILIKGHLGPRKLPQTRYSPQELKPSHQGRGGSRPFQGLLSLAQNGCTP